MNDYKAVYKNTGTTPRTLGEAYRNADYATPVYRHVNQEWQDAKDFFVGMFLVLGASGLVAVVVLAFLTWLGVA